MANTTTNGHIESLIDYVLDVKPYHVKLAGGVEEYVFHEDSLTVNFTEEKQMMVVMGPDYINASNVPERKVWANSSIRPLSSTSATRSVQSDGQRRVYSIPAMLFNKTGSETGNVFTKTAVSAATEIPGLNLGLFDTRAFSPNYGKIVGVKKNNVDLVRDQDFFVSKGCFSFDVEVGEGGGVWRRNDGVGDAHDGAYFFNDVIKKFGRVYDISSSASVFEEWKLTYRDETSVYVIGSITGDVGNATFGVPFVHANIQFTYGANVGEEAIPVMQPGDEFLLTAANKICIHSGATDQTWTLMDCGGYYKVYGSTSGLMDDAIVGEWYDNGEIAFKIPKLEAWVYINGVSSDTAILTDKSVHANCQNLFLDSTFGLDDTQELDGYYNPLDARPSVYTIKFHEGSPAVAGEVHSASVFNNVRGYRPGLVKGTFWNDGWLTVKADGNWQEGDEIMVVLAPQGSQTWFGGYDEAMYEWTLYDMGTAERPIPLNMLQPYFPLYHSKDAVFVPSTVAGDVIKIEKAQRDYVRLKFQNTNGNPIHNALGAEGGWIPLEYRTNVPVPQFATSITAYLATDPTMRVFTITQPEINGKPGLASLEFDQTFFSNFVSNTTLMTFEFHQSDNYGPKVGVNMTEELIIQVNTIPWDLFLDGGFNLDGSEELDGMQNPGV